MLTIPIPILTNATIQGVFYMMNQTAIYDSITQKIMADMEQGILTWRKPWSSEHLTGSVMRPLRWNNVPYTGINTIMLWATAAERGFTTPCWMTYGQAQHLKAHVRKGEKGATVVYSDIVEKEEQDKDGKATIQKLPFLKTYTVFNVGQIEGLPEHYYATPKVIYNNKEERIEAIERFFEQTKAVIRSGMEASYSITTDLIEMPPFECFTDSTGYYATLAHELTHWTRHPSRLNRDFNRKRWGDEGYAREELVAELGACFLSAELGIAPASHTQHAAYIQSWLSVLKNDRKFIVQAASFAHKAVEYVLSLQPQNKPVANLSMEVSG